MSNWNKFTHGNAYDCVLYMTCNNVLRTCDEKILTITHTTLLISCTKWLTFKRNWSHFLLQNSFRAMTRSDSLLPNGYNSRWHCSLTRTPIHLYSTMINALKEEGESYVLNNSKIYTWLVESLHGSPRTSFKKGDSTSKCFESTYRQKIWRSIPFPHMACK